ncbi:MAG: 50S ribosomal protein L4 [Cytophagales bacterium]
MKLPIYNIEGKETGKQAELAKEVFQIEPNEHVVYLAVKNYLNNQRQGTAKSKERAEITGSTRKLKRQKGTGTARQGSIKSPILKGGGTVFGPRPRNYGFKLNKKERILAKKSVLSQKAKDKGITILEDFTLKQPKTKDFINILNNLGKSDSKSLIITEKSDLNLFKSSRNIPNTKVIPASEVTTYTLMNCNSLIFTESGLKAIAENIN